MTDEATDYEDIVSGTIDEVKTAVDEHDLDLERLLNAEQANKDRITLIEWLEEQIEEAVPEEVDVTDQDDEAQYTPMEALPIQQRTATFVAGLVLGVVLVTALVMGGVIGTTSAQDASKATVQDSLQTYLSDNRQAFQLPSESSFTVATPERVEGTGLYEATVTVEATVGNRTLSQDMPAYVTTDARYLLIGRLFDMSVPVAEQTPDSGTTSTR